MTSTMPAAADPTSWTATSSCGRGRLAARPTGGGWGWRCCSSAGWPPGCGCARRPCRRSRRPRPPGRGRPRRGCRGRAGRAAGVDGAGRRRAGVIGDERADRGEGDRRAPGPHRLPVRAPVHAAPGADQHRVRRPPVRVAADGRSRWAGRPSRSSPSTPTRASPAPRPPTGKASSAWSPRSAWAGPGSCSAWRSPGWPATTPTGTGCWRSAPCPAR